MVTQRKKGLVPKEKDLVHKTMVGLLADEI